MQGKRTFSVIGNCQAPYLAEALLSNKDFNDHYTWVKIPPIHLIQRSEIHTYFEKLKELDLVIHQPVVDKKRFGEFETGNLRNQLTETLTLICIPSCYFNGYFPTISTVSGIKTPADSVHDMAVFHAFDLGIPIQKTVELLYQKNIFYNHYYIERWQSAVTALKQREIDAAVDIELSNFINETGRHEILMNQFNHPKKKIFKFLSEKIFETLGIEQNETRPEKDLDNIIWPVLPWVKDELRIHSQESEKLIVRGTEVSWEEFVSGSFKSYQNMPAIQRNACVKRNTQVRSLLEDVL